MTGILVEALCLLVGCIVTVLTLPAQVAFWRES